MTYFREAVVNTQEMLDLLVLTRRVLKLNLRDSFNTGQVRK